MSESFEEELLTVKQAAEFLHCKPQTLDRYRMNKTGPPYSRIGVGRGKILHRKSALIEWVKSNEGRTAQ